MHWMPIVKLLIFLKVLARVCLADKHLYGSQTDAFCPVTGKRLDLHSAAYVEMKYGQKIYLKNEEAANKYLAHPRKYWMSGFDLPLRGRDGERGLPDRHNQTVHCPVTNTTFKVKQMESPRLMHKGGQFIYFCCYDCLVTFWREPANYIVGADPSANAVDPPSTNSGLSSGIIQNSMVYTLCGTIIFQVLVLVCSYEVRRQFKQARQREKNETNHQQQNKLPAKTADMYRDVA